MTSAYHANPTPQSPKNSSLPIQQFRRHLDQVLAQEVAKLIGKENLDRIAKVWAEDNLPQTTQVRSIDEVTREIENSGIVLDDDLITLLQNTPPKEVRDAVNAFKEALGEGRAKYPTNFLKAAIRGKYKPNS